MEELKQRLAGEGKLRLSIRVIPKSPKTEWAGQREDGAYKVRLNAVPEKGKANEELIRFLAREFGVGRDQVEVVAGATSQNKMVRITR